MHVDVLRLPVQVAHFVKHGAVGECPAEMVQVTLPTGMEGLHRLRTTMCSRSLPKQPLPCACEEKCRLLFAARANVPLEELLPRDNLHIAFASQVQHRRAGVGAPLVLDEEVVEASVEQINGVTMQKELPQILLQPLTSDREVRRRRLIHERVHGDRLGGGLRGRELGWQLHGEARHDVRLVVAWTAPWKAQDARCFNAIVQILVNLGHHMLDMFFGGSPHQRQACRQEPKQAVVHVCGLYAHDGLHDALEDCRVGGADFTIAFDVQHPCTERVESHVRSAEGPSEYSETGSEARACT